jgi:hypothetical protein
VSAQPALDTDAAMVLGIASTAMPFAHSTEAEVERWLRILRLHGEAARVLQALGVSEAPLEEADPGGGSEGSATVRDDGREDPVDAVSASATRIAAERGAPTVATSDVLLAVGELYGADFDRVLRAHGSDREEVLERLGARAPASAER